jgi:hypothetical protein
VQSASRGIQSVGREWDHVHVHEFKSVQLFVFHISSTKDEDDFFCSSSSRSNFLSFIYRRPRMKMIFFVRVQVGLPSLVD